MKLDHKIALVTGATRGIGKAIALKLASEGATVLVNYRGQNQEKALATKQEIEQAGGTCFLINGDVASFQQTKEMFDQIKKEFGRLDILVNNAGITRDQLILRMKEEDFDQVIDVNLKGTFNCMKHATRLMMKQKSGRIVSLSSVVCVMGNAGQVNYAASKAGIIGMTKSLAREVAKKGVTVNAIAPGFIQTDMTDVLSGDVKEQMLGQIPLGCFGEVDDIASTVLFLVSDDARYITGQTIHVDGGMAM